MPCYKFNACVVFHALRRYQGSRQPQPAASQQPTSRQRAAAAAGSQPPATHAASSQTGHVASLQGSMEGPESVISSPVTADTMDESAQAQQADEEDMDTGLIGSLEPEAIDVASNMLLQ